ncbi:GNAT family N-acetyltransferase [Stappia sp. 28M-7]|uniref:GNAT family N-acetyltransferase n=1 Tax=Stappia sp. 28M-7 TaxID=2762596 RepID=UPI00163CDDD7|nr:GNAT family N-acetyltransferase [Stappia sp. 28M-7]
MSAPAGAFVVRVAGPEDVPALHELWLAEADRRDWSPAASPEGLLPELDLLAAENRVWGAFRRGRPVAMAAAGELDGAMWLSVMGVASACRGGGLSRSLLASLLGHGAWAGYSALVAFARPERGGFLDHVGFLRLDAGQLDAGARNIAARYGVEPWARRL